MLQHTPLVQEVNNFLADQHPKFNPTSPFTAGLQKFQHRNPPYMDNKHWLTALSVFGQDKAAWCLTHRSLWEIHGLEDETHDVGHLDDLAAHQTQLLVVVQHSVHVLDPQSVDGAVKDDPLAVWGVSWSELSECVSDNSICPLKKASITDMFNASCK